MFAFLMLADVVVTLGTVTLVAVSFRRIADRLFMRNHLRLDKISRGLKLQQASAWSLSLRSPLSDVHTKDLN